MPRKKIEFSDEVNGKIVELVKINKSVREIQEELLRVFGFKVGKDSLRLHIDALNIEKVDGRKFNGNHSRGYAATEVASKKKPVSKYKLKKLNEEDVCTREDAKLIGYDEEGYPLNYKLIKDKTGEVVEVELTITLNNIIYNGGKGCQRCSKRWWTIERMRFDFGAKDRPILKGMISKDWRGVVNRFNYDENDCYRSYKIDIVKEQQNAWERYVDAVYNTLEGGNVTYNLSSYDKDNTNKFIISGFNEIKMNELIKYAPDFIYRYIPTYLYSNVITYCIEKMYNDDRVDSANGGDYDVLNKIKNITSHIKNTPTKNELNKIDLDLIKKCLLNNPNDYDVVIKQCCMQAMAKELISKNYIETLTYLMSCMNIKSVDDKYTLNEVDCFAVMGEHANDFMTMFEKREREMNEFCEKYGLIY